MMMAFAMAQQPATTPMRTGPSFYFGGGPTFSTFTGESADDAALLVGAQVGMGMMWQLSNNFSVVPELNVSMQGSKWDVPSEHSYRLFYLNLPVVVRYQFGQSGVFGETGPQLGLLLDARRVAGDDKRDVSESFKSTSLNWNFGLGYNLNNNITINARVAPGLTDIDKSSVSTLKQFTSALRVTVGF
jgi:hypothetical protein